MRIPILYLVIPVLFILMVPTGSFAQNVALEYENQPLNEVLIDINEKYGTEVSIDARLSTSCLITISDSYSSMLEAVSALAGICGLEVSLINEVYSFRSRQRSEGGDDLPRYLYQGKIVEAGTGEALPYTTIAMEDHALIADADGHFSFKVVSADTRIQFSHLGYQLADTVIEHGNQLEVAMKPGAIKLEEVVISAAIAAVSAGYGEEAGHIKLNDVSTKLIPGDNSNLIFNHLRLFPGITASGESLSDYIIWGSYAGHNHVIFDGITLFSSYGIYDDVGRVNPLLVKNIEVYKGAYNVDVGDRIGGIVVIDGKTGNQNKVDGKVSISNEMANAYLSFPLSKGQRASTTLQLAGRISYYQALNWNTLIDQRSDDFIIPEYSYRDGNLKFSTSFKNNDKLEISAMVSGDTYLEMLSREGNSRYIRELDVNSLQVGTSMSYLRNWKRGGITTFHFSQSHYNSDLVSKIQFQRDVNPDIDINVLDSWTNPIREYSSRIKHRFTAAKRQDIQLALSHIRNQYEFRSESSISLNDLEEHTDRLSFFIKDDISVADRFSLRLGLKVDMPFSDFQPYFQPRINGKVRMADRWNLSFGWGMYNQFISKTPVFDAEGNRLVIWQTADGETIPVLSSMHNAIGLSYLSPHFEMNLEGYFRSTEDISRFFENRNTGNGFFREGESRAYGMDAYVKTKFCNHELWASYSLAYTEEKFNQTMDFREAAHSQRHEFKTALILNFKPVQIAITNVYGTGFPSIELQSDAMVYVPYNRLDLAFRYGVDIRKTRLETGFSILNILNRENVRLNQFVSFPDGTTASTSGIPFTPSIYVNFAF